MYLIQLVLFLLLLVDQTTPAKAPAPYQSSKTVISPEAVLYKELFLEGIISFDIFSKAVKGVEVYHPKKNFLAIADFSKASSERRFFIIDLNNRKLVMTTFVAHGKNSGELMANNFSNAPQSFKSSPGFYLVNNVIQSPKHGEALLLEGLEKGINDNARKREIIIHGASYVCEEFIKNNGRLGRSYGCPAVPLEDMHKVREHLAGGSLLYIYSPSHK